MKQLLLSLTTEDARVLLDELRQIQVDYDSVMGLLQRKLTDYFEPKVLGINVSDTITIAEKLNE